MKGHHMCFCFALLLLSIPPAPFPVVPVDSVAAMRNVLLQEDKAAVAAAALFPTLQPDFCLVSRRTCAATLVFLHRGQNGGPK